MGDLGSGLVLRPRQRELGVLTSRSKGSRQGKVRYGSYYWVDVGTGRLLISGSARPCSLSGQRDPLGAVREEQGALQMHFVVDSRRETWMRERGRILMGAPLLGF